MPLDRSPALSLAAVAAPRVISEEELAGGAAIGSNTIDWPVCIHACSRSQRVLLTRSIFFYQGVLYDSLCSSEGRSCHSNPCLVLPLVVAKGTTLEIAHFLKRRLPQLAWLLRSSTARDASVAMRSLPIDLGVEVRHSVHGPLDVSCISLFVDRCRGHPIVKPVCTAPHLMDHQEHHGGTWGQVYKF